MGEGRGEGSQPSKLFLPSFLFSVSRSSPVLTGEVSAQWTEGVFFLFIPYTKSPQ